jgi:hypothetical protein
MAWWRTLVVWLLIIGAESLQGIVRTLLLVPRIGDLRARQVGVLTGTAIILLVTWFSIRWLRVVSTRGLLASGAAWVALTVCFEIALGRALGYGWGSILADYDPRAGGFLGLGLLAMLLAPLLVARLRGIAPATGRRTP